jgi:hypothetical protein
MSAMRSDKVEPRRSGDAEVLDLRNGCTDVCRLALRHDDLSQLAR